MGHSLCRHLKRKIAVIGFRSFSPATKAIQYIFFLKKILLKINTFIYIYIFFFLLTYEYDMSFFLDLILEIQY